MYLRRGLVLPERASHRRPLSPHLTIWRWGPWAIVSIIHRITGVGLALIGVPALVWFLGAVASGPEAYAVFLSFWSGWFGQLLLIGLTWAVFQHMLSGVRHFFMDVGAGYELKIARRSSLIVFTGSIILTIGYWGWLLLR